MKALLNIRNRVLLLAILPALLIAILLTTYSSWQSLREVDEGLHERGRVIASHLAAASEYGVISGNTVTLQNLVQRSMSQETSMQAVLVTDSLGRTLAVSGRTGLEASVKDTVGADKLREWENNGVLIFNAPVLRSHVEIDDYAMLDGESAKSSANAQVIGQVFITLSTSDLANLKRSLINNNVLIALAGLFASAMIGLKIGRGITAPIKSLAGNAKRIAEGDLEARVPEDSYGELGMLERAFNHMADQLHQAHDQMQARIDDATRLLSYQAHYDALTGLINRREIESRLERALKTAHDHNKQHVFCYMDLDQFKIVNDTCGHHAGDRLLKQLSHLLSNRVRERDTLARLGGDEFGLLLESCTTEAALPIAEELLEMIRAFRFIHDDKTFNIGASIGMVTVTAETESVENIMSAADAACYAAKDSGRNRIHLFEHDDADLVRRRGEMQWVSQITRALEEDRFRLFCQPILPILENSSDTRHFEILLRKISANGEIVSPMAFIPAAERFDMMQAIDRWVIQETFKTYRKLLDNQSGDSTVVFAINLSGTSVGNAGLLDFIKAQFIEQGIPPRGICFEITETSAIINLGNTIKLIESLKGLGCRFLLDDFGSGMSSFAYLKNLQVDYIKIDGAFVKDIASNKIDLAMVKSIQNIAEAMQIKTIAEFVEDASMVELLVSIGVNYGQGYFLGRPEPIEQAIERL
jgi:diguanylate cyclase (GGDEF)-like protein